MQHKHVNIDQAFSFGWDNLKSSIMLFAVLVLCQGILEVTSSVIGAIYENEYAIVVPVSFAASFFQLIIDVMLIQAALKCCTGEKAEFSQLNADMSAVLKSLGASIIYVAIVIIGFLLLIIPGIILGIKLQYYMHLIVHKGLGPIEALKTSYKITKGVTFKLFLFGIISSIVAAVGFLALGFGALITVPLALIANVYVYYSLYDQTIKDDQDENKEVLTV